MDTFTQRIESAAARGRGDIVFLQGDEADRVPWSQPVSYTHLTLPTITE